MSTSSVKSGRCCAPAPTAAVAVRSKAQKRVNRFGLGMRRIVAIHRCSVNGLGGQRSEVRDRRSEVRGQRSEIQTWEIRRGRSGFKVQRSVKRTSAPFWPLTSDLRPPTSNLQPPTSDLRPLPTDLRPPASDLRPVDFRDDPFLSYAHQFG